MKLFNDFESENISGLTFELKIIYLKELFEKNKESFLVVANSLYEANKFYQSLLEYTNNILLFPMDDFLTSEAIAASPELKITRLETITELQTNNKFIVITNLMGLLRFLPAKQLFSSKKMKLVVGQEYDIKKLVLDLFDLGYEKSITVNKTGDIATRGFVVDIFPISSTNPIRIEFWGNEIDSIREFDVDNQLTISKTNEVEINSITEFLTSTEIDKFSLPHRMLNKYEKVYSILDFVNGNVIFNDYLQLETSYNGLLEEMYNYSISENSNGDTIYMHDLKKLKYSNVKYFNDFDNGKISNDYVNYETYEIEPLNLPRDEINKRLAMYLNKYQKVYLCVSNLKNANKIQNMLENKDIVLTDENNYVSNKVNIIVKKMNKGFILNSNVYISENDIFLKQMDNHYKTKFKLGTKIRDISKLNIGDFVVHSMHGIGIYVGIKSLEKNGIKKDYLLINYRDNDKLYIPVEKIDMISKYSSKEGYQPKLNKLGSVEWEKTKLKARKKIEDIAVELLKLYALREAINGYSFPVDGEEQFEFEKEFSYSETLDQIKVIEEIKTDMQKKSPMDRLLCGDVGYGKTEVAFRAIFKAIMGNKQAAILCPTTILSSQHYKNALVRFKSFPINIEILNRFVTPRKVKEILDKLKEGKIDLLIGTHRILSNDVVFKDLGLLVIDEEQRFGVKHKEKIKSYKNNIDVLTLSATPIPRTLQMSMAGLRSLSLIETPPVDRYPIQTYVLAENKQIIKDAIYKELSRKGQCFILFNNIEQMRVKEREISSLVPDAKIICAHGKMGKTELEEIMYEFTEGKYDILLCTTIIETGIDIPNANTLIIYEADHFGLSQLYQIRGRVGRSNKIAYCYLMYNKQKILSEIAIKRLNAIKEFTELGSGFAIAMRDLSIRGAGDILGSEQAGFIDTIGIELFMQMLDDEINKLKGIEVEEEEEETQPLIEVATSIDDEYVAEEELKIEIHKKINSINSKEKLLLIKSELEDRFGTLSEDIIIYMYEEWLEKLARKLNINKIKQGKNSIEITISEQNLKTIDGQDLFLGVNKISRMFRFSMKSKCLIITLDIVKLDKHFVYYLIDLLELIEKIKK